MITKLEFEEGGILVGRIVALVCCLSIAGIGLLVFDCSVGIYLAYRFYKGILKRYS